MIRRRARQGCLWAAAALVALAMIAAPAGAATDAVLVKDIGPGAGGSDPQLLIEADGALFFSATDGTHGTELWTSDGTDNGTRLVKDINPGAASSIVYDFFGVQQATVYGTVFFRADDGVHGPELWKSDGTASGTSLVADILPGPAGSEPLQMIDFNGTLYFSANDGVHGREPWMSDGTSVGTRLLRDVVPGPSGDGFENALGVDDKLFFTAADLDTDREQLWSTDGTAAGTAFVAVIYCASCDRITVLEADFKGLLILRRRGGCCGARQFFRSDGTLDGTYMFDGTYVLSSLAILNGSLYYFHLPSEPAEGTAELWRSDATETGTTLVTEITPGSPSTVSGPTVVNGTLLFFRYSVWPEPGTVSVWASDGSAGGTRMVTSLGSRGCRFCGVGGQTVVGNRLFVGTSIEGLGYELWETDGTADGTRLVRDVNPGVADSNPQSLTPVGGTLYFTATDGTHGRELWKTTPPIKIPPRRGDYKNTSGYCKAEEEFLREDAFREKYGTGKNDANAHGKCVKRNGWSR